MKKHDLTIYNSGLGGYCIDEQGIVYNKKKGNVVKLYNRTKQGFSSVNLHNSIFKKTIRYIIPKMIAKIAHNIDTDLIGFKDGDINNNSFDNIIIFNNKNDERKHYYKFNKIPTIHGNDPVVEYDLENNVSKLLKAIDNEITVNTYLFHNGKEIDRYIVSPYGDIYDTKHNRYLKPKYASSTSVFHTISIDGKGIGISLNRMLYESYYKTRLTVKKNVMSTTTDRSIFSLKV